MATRATSIYVTAFEKQQLCVRVYTRGVVEIVISEHEAQLYDLSRPPR